MNRRHAELCHDSIKTLRYRRGLNQAAGAIVMIEHLKALTMTHAIVLAAKFVFLAIGIAGIDIVHSIEISR